jgi:hypothetical protein
MGIILPRRAPSCPPGCYTAHMDLSHPYRALCPTVDGDVLTVLAGTHRPLTGREVARLAGRRSHRGVLDALSRLTDQGLVDRQEAGSAFLYTLNREHLAAPAVTVLADMRSELLRRLRHTIDTWEIPPVHASMFGSAARGAGDTSSDIDLFIVRPGEVDDEDPMWRDQLAALGTNVRRWTGNDAGIAEVDEAELPRLRERKPPIVQNLRHDAISLYGGNAEQLFAARQ